MKLRRTSRRGHASRRPELPPEPAFHRIGSTFDGPPGQHRRPRVLPLDPMAVPPPFQGGARGTARGCGQLVVPDGARRRAGGAGPVRALPHDRADPLSPPVVDQDHALRAAASTRSTRSTGRSRPRQCSATGSGAARRRPSCSTSTVPAQGRDRVHHASDTLFGATFLVIGADHPESEDFVPPERIGEENAWRKTSPPTAAGPDFSIGMELSSATTRSPARASRYGRLPMCSVATGTGAIMAVPGHDARDLAFARAHSLPIVEVISGGDVDAAPYSGVGTLVNSGDFSGLSCDEGKRRIVERLHELRRGEPSVQYKLRDWLISRQRYWLLADPYHPLPQGRSGRGAGGGSPGAAPRRRGLPSSRHRSLAARHGGGSGSTSRAPKMR